MNLHPQEERQQLQHVELLKILKILQRQVQVVHAQILQVNQHLRPAVLQVDRLQVVPAVRGQALQVNQHLGLVVLQVDQLQVVQETLLHVAVAQVLGVETNKIYSTINLEQYVSGIALD